MVPCDGGRGTDAQTVPGLSLIETDRTQLRYVNLRPASSHVLSGLTFEAGVASVAELDSFLFDQLCQSYSVFFILLRNDKKHKTICSSNDDMFINQWQVKYVIAQRRAAAGRSLHKSHGIIQY